MLLSGLGFISVIISLSLKFRVYALRLDHLQSTVWLWFLWKCQRTFIDTWSSLFATLLKNQQLMHHLHSLHHLLPFTLDLRVLSLILIKLMGFGWRWPRKMNKGRNANCMKDPRNSKILRQLNYHGWNLCLMEKVKCNKSSVRSTPMLKGNISSRLLILIACWNNKVVKKPKCRCLVLMHDHSTSMKNLYMLEMNVFTLLITTHLFWTSSK